jgi:hypothetical protein
MAWFMLRGGSAGIHWLKIFLHGSSHSIAACVHCSYVAYSGEILFWVVVLSQASTEGVILTYVPPDLLSIRCQDK